MLTFVQVLPDQIDDEPGQTGVEVARVVMTQANCRRLVEMMSRMLDHYPSRPDTSGHTKTNQAAE